PFVWPRATSRAPGAIGTLPFSSGSAPSRKEEDARPAQCPRLPNRYSLLLGERRPFLLRRTRGRLGLPLAGHRALRAPVDDELENVWAGIVPDCVEVVLTPHHVVEIQVGGEDRLTVDRRAGQDLAQRRDDHRGAPAEDGIGVGDPLDRV